LAGLAMLGAHSMFKAALFLTVGIVDAATGTRDLRRLTGVGRALPITATAGALATLSMIGMWPFAGFVAKEAALEALLADAGTGAGATLLVAMVVGSALTAAYGLRFWWGAFWDKSSRAADADAPRPSADLTGPAGTPAAEQPRQGATARPQGDGAVATAGAPGVVGANGSVDVVGAAEEPLRISPVPLLLTGPALVLALLGLVLALVPAAGETLLQPYATTYPEVGEPGHVALWAGFTPALGLSALILAVGLALFAARARVERAQARLTFPADADRAYRRAMRRLDDVAADVTALTQRGSLPMYLGTILVVMVAVELATGYG